MEIKIEVSEDRVKDILDRELEAFTSEEIHKIIENCIGDYLREQNYANLKYLILQNANAEYWNREPSSLVKRAIQTCDFSGLQDVADKMIEALKTDYRQILMDAFIECIADKITNTYTIRQSVETISRNMLSANFR